MVKERIESPAMTTTHLNSQVRKFDGFAHGQRVFVGAPKMPIGAVGNPHFDDFMNSGEAPTAETHHLFGAIRQIRQAPLAADFSGELNLATGGRIRESEMKNSYYVKLRFPSDKSENKKAEGDG